MSFENKIVEEDNLARYKELKQRSANLLSQVEQFVVDMQNLKAATDDSTEDSEVDAIRANFISTARSHLGV